MMIFQSNFSITVSDAYIALLYQTNVPASNVASSLLECNELNPVSELSVSTSTLTPAPFTAFPSLPFCDFKIGLFIDELFAALLASNDMIELVQPFLIALVYEPLDAGSSGKCGKSGVREVEDVVYS